MSWLATILLYLWIASSTRADLCPGERCEYVFDIQWKETMTLYHSDTGRQYDVESKEGELKVVRGGTGLTNPLIGLTVDAQDIIVGDGLHRNVITINGIFPGPNIEVMEGTEVVVRVQNNLDTEAVTIHWHGMYQKRRQWMDGVANITQCPIEPGETFTYTFIASPGGTHWYHSHVLNQRNDGIYGGLVVHRLHTPSHIVVLSQMFQYEAKDIREMAAATDELKRHQMHSNGMQHDPTLGFENHSVIINGRGRQDLSDKAITWIEFPVNLGQGYKFSVIHAGADYALKFSIDEHRLTVLSSDGFEVKPTEVDKFYIYPGETLEFGISTDQKRESSWIRVEETQLHRHNHPGKGTGGDGGGMHSHDQKAAIKKRQTNETSETTQAPGEPILNTVPMNLHAYAVLRYTDIPSVTLPETMPLDCLTETCIVFNCPEATADPGETCIPFGEVAGFDSTNSKVWGKLNLLQEPDHEVVLNFMLSGKPGATGSSVNGKKFIWPPAPMFNFEAKENDCQKCNDCDNCTYIVTLPPKKIVDLTISNLQREQPVYSHHPVHLHGYHFAVMKVGYPSYDNITNTWTPALGITCKDVYCTQVHRVKDVRRHALELHGVEPPLKNTILVPSQGFVDVRIYTDNPGFWFMHCHTAQHLLDGMAVIIEVPPFPKVPEDFPCFKGYATPKNAAVPSQLSRSCWVVFLQVLSFMISTVLLYVL